MTLTSFQCIIRSALISVQLQTVISISMVKKHSYLKNTNPEDDITDYIYSKGYLPIEKDLPETFVTKSDVSDDVTYLLTKLTDNELITLLNSQPKKDEYDINDVLKIALKSKPNQDNLKYKGITKNFQDMLNDVTHKKNTKSEPHKVHSQAFYKLDHKPVHNITAKPDASYKAVQKLHYLLNQYPQTQDSESVEDLEKKEILFDVLVSQLKTLCCNKNKPPRAQGKHYYKTSSRENGQLNKDKSPSEYIFLIVNEEIKSNTSEDLVKVDPDSLDSNSTVLLLGPITTPLSDNQLKLVIGRISNELSKSEYLPLLHQLSQGSLSDKNSKLMKSVITGPETRRYIKPHRCNYQSKLARIFGGPRWLICTGYLNLNVPSFYD